MEFRKPAKHFNKTIRHTIIVPMDLYRRQMQRERYLLTVHKMVQGNTTQGVLGDEVMGQLGMEKAEADDIAVYLRDEGLLKFKTFGSIGLEHEGKKKAEQLQSLPYEELEGRVLWMITEICHGSLTKLVLIEDIARGLVKEPSELFPIIDDLDERKGLIKAYNEAVLLLPAGKEALQEMTKPKPPARVSSDVFITNVHGDNYGAIQVGHGNTQSVVTTQSVAEMLPKLADFIQAVKAADFPDKEDAINDLDQVLRLAQGELSESVWRRIQTKLTAAKTTMEVAGLVYKTFPYWPQIWDFFNRHIR